MAQKELTGEREEERHKLELQTSWLDLSSDDREIITRIRGSLTKPKLVASA